MVVTKKTSSKSRFGKKLANISSLWGKAKEKAEALKGGNYIEEPMQGIFRLTSAEIAEIGDKNWLHAAFEFTCLSDDFKGQVHNHRCGIESEDSLGFLIKDLQRLGVDTDAVAVDSIDELEELLKELVSEGPCVRAKLVQAKDSEYLNMRIQKLVEVEEEDEPEAEEEEEEKPKGKAKTGKIKKEEVVEEEEEETVVADEDEETMTIEVGSKVKWEYKGKTRTGVVKKLIDDEGTIHVTADDDKKVHLLKPGSYELVEEEEPFEEEEVVEEEEVELGKGTKISATFKGKERTGEVLSVQAEKGTVKAKLTGVPGMVTLKIDEIEVLEG